MRKLILRCNLAAGDIVMLTAAVRDLHTCYPGRFITDVRTRCDDLWLNNPWITPLSEEDSEVEELNCRYPLIRFANRTPHHCLHGFVYFLNERLQLAIRPTAYHGDIHLSEREKSWCSQVREVTGENIPYWIVAAGGKQDVTIKWWSIERYQQVVDRFRGRVQFVQIGYWQHHHPKLNGVIDFRGRTTLRELVRLVYHSQGVLSPVTGVMHLAAAVPTAKRFPKRRPCVVIAGGREPMSWASYPDHQFIHNNGALACCSGGGCWKDRTFRLRDGDCRDNRDRLCVNVVNELPRCMDMITADEVVRRIETYFNGGVVRYLRPGQRIAAERGVKATAKNIYDRQPLSLPFAGMACDRAARSIPEYPDHSEGRGIVICGGGPVFFPNAWVCINMLRFAGNRLPIELWYRGRREMDDTMKSLVAPLGVQCVDAEKLRRKTPARILKGWPLKSYAILHSSFREILFLDADNVPVVDPEYLFDTAQFRKTGALFWPDYPRVTTNPRIWHSCGMRPPLEAEFETGQIVLDKRRCWRALSLTRWFNDQADFYYGYMHGDKDTFHLAFRKLRKRYALVPVPAFNIEDTKCQHDFDGRRIFQHRSEDKWTLSGENKTVKDFWYEAECRDFLNRLRQLWNGRVGGSPRFSTASAEAAVRLLDHIDPPLSNSAA